jgi:hypothetical protein
MAWWLAKACAFSALLHANVLFVHIGVDGCVIVFNFFVVFRKE